MSMEELGPDIEALIEKLDADRHYGMPGDDRVLLVEDVIAGIRSGAILITAGQNLPVLKSADRGWVLRGSGVVIRTSAGPQQTALAEFRKRALDDLPFAYRSLINGMKRGDPRYDKIYWENLMGKMGENRGGDAVAEAFKAIIEAMKKPEERQVTVETKFE